MFFGLFVIELVVSQRYYALSFISMVRHSNLAII